MRDIELIVNSEAGSVTTGKNYAIKQENLQRKIIYKFDGEFVDGTAYLCVKKEDGVTGKIQMTKNGEQYELVIKNGLVSNTRSILINIKIVQAGSENNVPVFVSTVSQIKIEDTIQADMDMIDYYSDWHDSIEAQLAGKVDKEEGKGLSTNDFTDELETKLNGIEAGAEANVIEDVKVNGTSLEVENKSVNVVVPTALSDLSEDTTHRVVTDTEKSTWNSKIDKNVNDLVNYELKTNTGASIELSINSSTYVMTLNLKNSAGTVLSTGTVDLPLETMVVGASYDSQTKEIILTLQNGITVRFSVADLVSGLQTEITSQNKLASDLVDDTNQTNKFVTSAEKTKLDGIETGAEVNDIDTISINNVAQTIANKNVNITVPTKTSDLNNDSNFVVSTTTRIILELTQAQYDALQTIDSNTLYIIKEA